MNDYSCRLNRLTETIPECALCRERFPETAEATSREVVRYRQQWSLTLEQMGGKCGAGKSAVARWEAATTKPQMPYRHRIMQVITHHELDHRPDKCPLKRVNA